MTYLVFDLLQHKIMSYAIVKVAGEDLQFFWPKITTQILSFDDFW